MFIDREQLSFNETLEHLKVGDKLRVFKEGDKVYFLTEFGWRLNTLPAGTKIKLIHTAFTVPDTNVTEIPEIVTAIESPNFGNVISYKLGLEQNANLKLFSGDVIEIVAFKP